MSTLDKASVWKRQVPGGEPRVFPFVRHRDDVVADHVKPLAVADLAGRGPQRIDAMFLEPFIGIEKEVLLAPQHPGQRLPHYIGRIFADAGRCDRDCQTPSRYRTWIERRRVSSKVEPFPRSRLGRA